jgi:hypothetical protein
MEPAYGWKSVLINVDFWSSMMPTAMHNKKMDRFYYIEWKYDEA